MKKLICNEIGPNYDITDAMSALKVAIGFHKKSAISEVEEQLNQIIQITRKWYFTDSGRTGLTLLLRSLNLEQGSEVALQAFSCVVVPNSVLQAGLKPVIIDIEKENLGLSLDDLKQKTSPKIKVLILQYNFGLSFDVTKIVEYCRKNNILIIEDCAHSLGTLIKFKDSFVPAGTIGDAAFFSFGRDKIVSTTSGGSVIFNSHNSDWIKEFERQWQSLSPASVIKDIGLINSVWLFPLIIRPFYHYWIGKTTMAISKTAGIIPRVYVPREKLGTSEFEGYSMNTKLFPILNNQLKKLPETKKHRQTIARIYCQNLNVEFDRHSLYLRFPYIIQDDENKEKYNAIQNKLRKIGFVSSAVWYEGLFIPKEAQLDKFDYVHGMCPHAELTVKSSILNLPTNIHVTTTQAHAISEIIVSQG